MLHSVAGAKYSRALEMKANGVESPNAKKASPVGGAKRVDKKTFRSCFETKKQELHFSSKDDIEMSDEDDFKECKFLKKACF